jgi:hypothetical protein
MSKIDVDEGDQELVMDQSAYEMYHQAQTSRVEILLFLNNINLYTTIVSRSGHHFLIFLYMEKYIE